MRSRPLLLSLLLVGCARPAKVEPRIAAADTAAPRLTMDPAPLTGAPIERIDLGDGEEAFVALPVGARERRPIFVGVHGAGDRADWACAEWQQVTAGYAIVVCPRSKHVHAQDPNAYVWGSAEQIASAAERAVAAVRERVAPWALDAPLVYAGWSQGGTLAADVVRARPGVYDRAVLVEVGHTALDPDAVARGLRTGGVEHAVVACESAKCRSFADAFARSARRQRLAVTVGDAGSRPHLFDEPVYRALAPRIAELHSEDARYAGLTAAIDARWSTD